LFRAADVLISAANPHRVLIAAAAITVGVLACRETTTPQAKAVNADMSSTMGSGFTSTVISRGNLGPVHVQSRVAGFEVELKARQNTDIAIANIAITQGGFSGWHYHPGPVLVVVKSGTITFYSADQPNCAPKVHPAGTSFTEAGGIVGNARNEGATDVVAVATFFAPPAPSPLRIDAPVPEECVPGRGGNDGNDGGNQGGNH
jgi:quercetin dioxygenase-like cupin family protein